MTNIDWVFSVTSFDTFIVLLMVVGVFIYTFAVSLSKPQTHPPVDLMAGDEGEDW